MSSVRHDFHDSLKFSHEAEELPMWEEVYKAAFPRMVAMISYRSDGHHQREGIDRGVYLDNAKEVLIDEKVRRKDYGDVLLEYISNDRTRSPGWVAKRLRADYIAYAILPTRLCLMLPVLQLQLAWDRCGESWLSSFGTRKAANNGYQTLNCPVPVKTLFSEIGAGLRVNWS